MRLTVACATVAPPRNVGILYRRVNLEEKCDILDHMVPNVSDAQDMRKQAKDVEETAAVLTDKDAAGELADTAAELEDKADKVEADAE